MTTQPAMRIVFMGTPDFAVPVLQTLHEASQHNRWAIVGVVTQPDRAAGRGKKVQPSPVKRYATEQSLPILQPGRLRKEPDAIQALEAWAPDVIVVAAYGQILPANVLEIPEFGCINVHASLLPAYRGASPITAAILDGQDETGVSIMLMDEGMDTGPVLAQATQPIRSSDTTAALSERLARQGADLLVDVLPRWLAGTIAPVPQDELPGAPSICRLVKKQDGRIDWTRSAAHIERMTRAYQPWPSAYTFWAGQNFRILAAQVRPGAADPGLVVETDEGPAVGTGDGLLLLKEVQPAGKRPMSASSFLHGARNFIGSRLGDR